MDLNMVCSDFAKQLDQNDLSKSVEVAKLLSDVEPKELVAMVKTHIGIERLVHHNLDTVKEWNDLFDKATKWHEANK